MKQEIAKVRTKKGRIITLYISKRTDTHIEGMDKFGDYTKIALEEVDSLRPRGIMHMEKKCQS